ncbi:MAG: SDR family oxidoreductase [Acidimicrobiales bacterium]
MAWAGLEGRRMLVVGASSGIGRATALLAAASGASVVAAARRQELLAELAEGITLHRCDVADPEQALALGGHAAAHLGGLDVVVYAAGTAPLAPLATTTAQQWHEVLATNLVGAAMVVRGALDHLRAARSARKPAVALLSTHTVARPWPGLVAYAASKAGLDALARGLREEEPWLRVLDVAVTNTATGFADAWDPAHAGVAFTRWTSGAYLSGEILSAETMAGHILDALVDDGSDDDVVVSAPS